MLADLQQVAHGMDRCDVAHVDTGWCDGINQVQRIVMARHFGCARPRRVPGTMARPGKAGTLFDELDATLALVLGVQLGLAALLYLLARLEPLAPERDDADTSPR